MDRSAQSRSVIFHRITSSATVALMLVIVLAFALTIVASTEAQAQTYSVIHAFNGGADGARPQAGLTIDTAGNLYGTTGWGGAGIPVMALFIS